ncbi:MAG: transketolase family protein [Oscillospiraceae bacterium]|nr:transketolase family protein [Oscillospiraceae bacterium]
MAYSIIYDGKDEATPHKDVYAKTAMELAAEDPDVIFLDADLTNSSGASKLAAADPTRVINCGVQEANMIGVAAGLSAAGKKPYAHSFGPFASRRCFDQVFLSVAYAKNNVRIFGSDAGVTAAYNGGTHMPFEDMALMRAVPGSTVIDITDGVMLKEVLKMIKDRPGLTYIRSTRKKFKAVFGEGSKFEIGKGITLREGTDVTIVACGLMVGEAMRAAEILEENRISAKVVNIFTVKPIDADLIIQCANETGAIVVAENHNIIGGLCSAVSDVIVRNCPVPVEFVGVNDEFGEVGPQDYLMERFGLTADNVVEKVKAVLIRTGKL